MMKAITAGGLPQHRFKLWEKIKEALEPVEFLPGGRPKPEVVYREAEGALQPVAGQGVERFTQIRDAKPGQEQIPPALIVACDNTDRVQGRLCLATDCRV